MCSGSSSHLESIYNFVLKKKKIVTYKWLSKKLNIHTNTSKQLLFTFSLNNAGDNLSVTYLVSGTTENGVKVLIVSQSDLDKVKSGLVKVLSEHVYSVQKVSSQFFSSQLYLADSLSQNLNNEFSSISRRKVEERQLKVFPTHKTPATASSTSLQTITSKPLQKSPSNLSMPNGKAEETKSNLDSAESQKDEKSVAPAQDKKKKGVQNKGAGIGAFFNKQAEKKKNEPLKENKKANIEDNSPKQLDKSKEEAVEVDDESIPDTTNLESSQSVHKTPVYQRKKSHGKSKKKNTNKEEDNTPARKRKRIVLASDSESEEEVEEDIYVEEQPEQPGEVGAPTMDISESDEVDVIPPTPFGEKDKKRFRKQVDRTFVDDDGFVITKKEYIYVSCSDDENAEKVDSSDLTPKKAPTPKEKQPDEEDKITEEEPKGVVIEEKGQSKGKGNKSNVDKKGGRNKSKSPKKPPPNSKQQASITSFFKRK